MIDASGLPLVPTPSGGAALPSSTPASGTTSFSDLLKDLTQDVNRYQHQAQDMVEGLATGEVENVHDVVNALDKAELSFRMMVEVRNRLVEAYREISRMGA